MNRFRILLAAVLCVSLLTFAGCGAGNNTNDNATDGTVTEETTGMNNNGSKSDDDSVMDDLEKDAKDAADDVEDALDEDNNVNSSNAKK